MAEITHMLSGERNASALSQWVELPSWRWLAQAGHEEGPLMGTYESRSQEKAICEPREPVGERV